MSWQDLFCGCGCDDDDEGCFGEELREQQSATFWNKKECRTESSLPIYSRVSDQGALQMIVGDNEEDEDEEAQQQPTPVSQSFTLPSELDPDEEYYAIFSQLDSLSMGTNSQSARGVVMPAIDLSASQMEEMANESDAILSGPGAINLTPREVVVNLNRYNSCIRFIKDPAKKKTLIERYEKHKWEHDEDNRSDAENAELYLEGARNPRTKAEDRIKYYQMAIKYTNNLQIKETLRAEYRRYFYSLQNKKHNDNATSDGYNR